MKIGFVVYSATGNTRSVAQQLKVKLEKKGHTAEYLEVKPLCDPKESTGPIEFSKMHDLSEYDFLVFGSFIEAFNLNRCMAAYLKNMGDITGKKAIMLTTQQFPKKWLGGNQALKKMKKLLEEKGAEVLGGEDVNWTSKEEGRQERIDFAVTSLCGLV
jgi:flavodoxin